MHNLNSKTVHAVILMINFWWFSEAIGNTQLDGPAAQRLHPSPIVNAQIRWAAKLVLVGLTCSSSPVAYNFNLDCVAV